MYADRWLAEYNFKKPGPAEDTYGFFRNKVVKRAWNWMIKEDLEGTGEPWGNRGTGEPCGTPPPRIPRGFFPRDSAHT